MDALRCPSNDADVTKLSGGERRRVALCRLLLSRPDVLLLDEPTNHLDIDAREALVRALADFEGAVVLITHDPHLVDLVADTLWLVADGSVKPFDGDLDDYRALLTERARPAPKQEAGNQRDERRARADARAATAPLRKASKDAEARIARLTAELKKIEAKLADPDLYASARKGEVAAAQSTLAALKRQLQAAEAEWLAAEEALEAASA
jgi:ATP-binding cassette subfamily F protein 3